LKAASTIPTIRTHGLYVLKSLLPPDTQAVRPY